MAQRNGKRVLLPLGNESAKIVLVGGSPTLGSIQNNSPFGGGEGYILRQALLSAGIDINETYRTYVVPMKAPKDEFKNHTEEDKKWGLARLEEQLQSLNPDLVIALGDESLTALLGPFTGYGTGHSIRQWRGSLLHPTHWPLEGSDIAPAISGLSHERPWTVLAADDPEAVRQRFPWMVWHKIDFAKAARFLRGEVKLNPLADREWVINEPNRFPDFVDEIIDHSHLVAVDSETEPLPIVAFATEWAVHAFVMDARVKPHVDRLMSSPQVLKIAHNVAHDWIWFTERLGVPVMPPFADTMGFMHNLEPEGQKSLSPHQSTKYTDWPYHKWMVNINALVYCAMDAACCMDAYWPMIDEIQELNLWKLVEHDQKLNKYLLAMTARGLPVNVKARAEAEKELENDLFSAEEAFKVKAERVVDERLAYFKKPHLFQVEKQCPCCGGGKVQAKSCWRCGGLPAKPTKKVDYEPLMVEREKWTVAEAKNYLPICAECRGTGKVKVRLPINPASPSQMSDLLYRGLGIRPRKYKGSETIRIGQLESIRDMDPLLGEYIDMTTIRNEFETVARLRPDPSDGRLHAILDPWGTVSGRVASKEGLVLVGTNLMNIPYKARKFIVPPEGEFLLYPDMDQIEARCMAVLSQDPLLLDFFQRSRTDSSLDFHTYVMDMILDRTGFDFNSVGTGEHKGQGRFYSKKTSYAMFYGVREDHLAIELGVDVATSAEIVRAYGETFVGIPVYHRKIEGQMQRDRTWRSPTTRYRRFLDRILDRKTKTVSYEFLKKGWSGPPQDMAAWVLALGLFRIEEEYRHLLTPFVHVHDALLLSALMENRQAAVDAVRDSLTVEAFDMLFTCGVSVGPDWYGASLDDKDKPAEGYGDWVLETFLEAA